MTRFTKPQWAVIFGFLALCTAINVIPTLSGSSASSTLTLAAVEPTTAIPPVTPSTTTPSYAGTQAVSSSGKAPASSSGRAAPLSRTPGTASIHRVVTGGGVAGYSHSHAFVVTCYVLRGRGASGRMVGPGSAATDPRIVPMGRSLYVDGMGTYRADDTGGAIHGYRLDLWMASRHDCERFGRRTINVHY